MKELQVHTSTDDYKISIGKGLRFHLNDFLTKDYSAIFVITDSAVAPLYLDDVLKGLSSKNVYFYIIKSGEASKGIDTYYQLQTILMEHHLDRKSLVIALGGGVVGDLAGFVAATYMRGIDYIQVPTTILAHDSSVGGKVAINHELGKNMIGNFYPPKAVVYDVSTLTSLPEAEIRSGYAELVKEAFIANEDFLKQLFRIKLSNIPIEDLKQHLFEGIKVKAHVVEQDEREANIRKFLNFGHTLAHALETELGYGKVTHGEAVAVGMLFALQLSEVKFGKSLYFQELLHWLKVNHYPISLFDTNIEHLITHMKRDKKSTNQQLQMVLLEEIGTPTIVNVTDEEVKHRLKDFKKELNVL